MQRHCDFDDAALTAVDGRGVVGVGGEGVESGHECGEDAEKDIKGWERGGKGMEELEKRDVWACTKSNLIRVNILSYVLERSRYCLLGI